MMGKQRILHVYQSPSFSGAESYAAEVAIHQAKSADVTFLVRDSSPLASHLKPYSSMIKVATAMSEIDLSGFEIIILHSTQELKRHWPRLALAKILSKIRDGRIPRVVLYTHIWISHSKKDPLHAIPYSIVDRAWCSSEQSRRELERYLPLRGDRIEIVRYGRNTESQSEAFLDRKTAREKLSLPQGAIVVGTLARIDKGKGSRELFDAVTDLMQSRADLHLLMIGPPTSGDAKAVELDQQLEHDIEALVPAIRSRVHKMGRLENGTTYLKAFDLFILATYKENFALTLLEALLAEVPCLATDSGGSPDVVHPHATGWLFWPESTKALRETLLAALEQREKWADLGSRGRKFVSEKYDFNEVMRHMDRSIAGLTGR